MRSNGLPTYVVVSLTGSYSYLDYLTASLSIA